MGANEPTRGILNGKVAIVTGGASGIGRATAMLFAREGASVTIADVDEKLGQEAVQEIVHHRGLAAFEKVDVTAAVDCRQLVELTGKRFGGLHILVNDVGVIRRASVVELTEAEWDRVMDVNVKSVFLLSKFAIPLLARSGGGSIVNLASGWGLAGGPRAAAYCASKGAVVLLTKAMAIDHAGQNIRVNCVCPGDTDTPLLREEARQMGKASESFLTESARRPLRRVGRPEEIAQAVLYLASDASSFVTGTAHVVDGGGLAGTI